MMDEFEGEAKERGCGMRIKGGMYIECATSPNGNIPIDAFLIDPVVPIDLSSLGVSPVGMHLIKDERTGVTNVVDVIGAKHYPNAADFIEESFRMGVSRRASKKLDFSVLSPASRLLLIHPRAYITLDDAVSVVGFWQCKTAKRHADDMPHCIGQCWSDLGAATINGDADDDGMWTRVMPSFEYRGRSFDRMGIPVVDRQPAAIYTLPITNIACVRDPDDPETNERNMNLAKQSTLDVVMVDQ